MARHSNIVSLFIQASEKQPEKIAIVDKNGRKISFSKLAESVKRTATHYTQKGIQKGDRVLLFVPMGIDLYRNVLALLYIGATIVFVDQWSKIDRLNTCCQTADCKAFIGSWKAHFLRLFSKGIREIPIKLGLSYPDNAERELCTTSPTDAALITFTTGSTGIPKAALRTHGFLYEQFIALEEEIEAKPSDVDMTMLPIVLLINLAIGSTSIIADFNPSKPTSIRPQRILKQLLEHGVTRLVASPYFVKRIAAHVLEAKYPTPSLKAIYTGGAPVFLKEAKLYTKAFPAKKIQILYGSTEAEPISSISASKLASESDYFDLQQGLPVGAVFHKAQVKIIRITDQQLFDISQEAFEDIQLPDGMWGEIIVAGPHVLTQYYRNEQALHDNKICLNGVYWHRTGDSGYLQNGSLYLTGRCNTLIRQGKHWLSTFIFENYIQSVPNVEMGTILAHAGEITVFIELTEDTPQNRRTMTEKLQELPLAITTIKFQQLPRDPRHHSKIEYGKLRV